MKMQKNHQLTQMSTVSGSNKAEAQSVQQKFSTAVEIQSWLVRYLAELLEIDEVNVKIPFDRYGLDSTAAVGMISDLGNWLGLKLEPTLPYDFPTIEALAQHLASSEEFKTNA